MTALRASFLFGVRGLWLRREALGASHVFDRDGHRVEISLPKDRDDFRTWKRPAGGDRYSALGGWSGTADDPKQAFEVEAVRVTIDTEGAFTKADFSNGNHDLTLRAVAVADAAQELAQQVIKDFVAMIRAKHGFSWMGLSSDNIEQVGPASLIEIESGERIPVGPSLHFGAIVLKGVDASLAPADVQAAVSQISAGEQVPVPEALLADAEHLASAPGGTTGDPLRAILMAAIACEVKAKLVLRERVSEENAALLEYVLENPREITVTAADGLFNKVMKATHGRSLKEDDKGLFKEIVKLFEVRNSVAHRGQSPEVGEARRLVRAARRAFEWLDQETETAE